MTTTRTGDVMAAYGKVADHVGAVTAALVKARAQLELSMAAEGTAGYSIDDHLVVDRFMRLALGDLAELPPLVLALEATAHACGVSHAQEHRPRHLARG